MKNKLIKILSCLLIAVLSVCFFVACKTPSGAEKKEPSVGLSYKVNGDSKTCTITGMGTCTDSDLVVPESIDGYTVKSIANSAFQKCNTIVSVEIPKTVSAIEFAAFNGCEALTTVKILSESGFINTAAFMACTSLKELTIGDGVVYIDIGAFADCQSLTSVKIPSSVEYIGSDVFGGCTSLTEIKVESGNKNYCAIDGNLYTKDRSSLVQYAAGKKDESFTVPSHVTTIETYAFSGCKNLTFVEVSDSVQLIKYNAFTNCNEDFKVVIPTTATFEDFIWITRVPRLYYKGNIEQFKQALPDYIGKDLALILQKTFYYSEVEPTDERNYWHYDNNGNVVEWQ
ncbi:MAG: leucine-rich repeat domain-containing protein [Clostridia bacterium]|nr:leucine-rich repeat domain-containing protein [Clostridia bacterium]